MKILPKSLEIKLWELNPHDPSFVENWERIRNKSQIQNPFMTIEWLQSVKEAFGADFPFKSFLELKNGQETVGIIPFSVKKENICGPLKVSTFSVMHTGVGAPDHLDLLILPKFYEESVTALLEWVKNQKESVWIFKNFSQKSPLFKKYKNAIKSEGWIIQIPDTVCPYLDLSKIDDIEKWLMLNFKNNLRKRKKLLKDFSVETGYVKNLSELDEVLPKYLAFHEKRHGLKSPIVQSAASFNLLKIFCKKLLPLGNLSLFFIKVNGQFGAFEISFIGGKTLHSYQVAFNEDYQNYSLGSILDLFIVEEAYKQGLEKFDLLRGDESYKKKFANQAANDKNFIVFKKDLIGLVLYTSISFKNLIKRMVSKIN